MYGDLICRELEKFTFGDRYDVRHVEAYMRNEHPTLDGLTPKQFAVELGIACVCIDHGGIDSAESLARSLGL